MTTLIDVTNAYAELKAITDLTNAQLLLISDQINALFRDPERATAEADYLGITVEFDLVFDTWNSQSIPLMAAYENAINGIIDLPASTATLLSDSGRSMMAKTQGDIIRIKNDGLPKLALILRNPPIPAPMYSPEEIEQMGNAMVVEIA